MKYKDLSDTDKSDLVSIIDTTQEPQERKEENFGLCSTCKYFELVKSEFKILNSSCREQSNIIISIQEPVKFCSIYSKIGEMSLFDMSQIALFINLDKEKERVGF